MKNNALSKASQRRIDKAMQLATRPTKTANNAVNARLNSKCKLSFVRG